MNKTIEDYKKMIYKKDGYYYTNAWESIDGDRDEENFYKAILELLDDTEVMFVRDDTTTEDDSTGIIFYKLNNKLVDELIIEENGKFEFDLSGIAWSYPKFQDFTNKDFEEFVKRLNDYITDNNLNIIVKTSKTQKRVLEHPSNDYEVLNDKQVKNIKLLAYFWRYAIYLIIIALAFLAYFLTSSRPMFILVLAISFIILGVYYYIGYKYKFKHIYCVYQNSNHQKMTPNDINWYSLSKKDLIGMPIFFIISGLLFMAISILLLLNIIE